MGTQVQPQILLDPEYLPDYLCVSYDYDDSKKYNDVQIFILLLSLNNIEMSNDATFFQFSLWKLSLKKSVHILEYIYANSGSKHTKKYLIVVYLLIFQIYND